MGTLAGIMLTWEKFHEHTCTEIPYSCPIPNCLSSSTVNLCSDHSIVYSLHVLAVWMRACYACS